MGQRKAKAKPSSPTSSDSEPEEAANDDPEDDCVIALLARAKAIGSVSLWCNQVNVKNFRNKRECLALAEAFDALLAEGINEDSKGLDILARRLIGVQLADNSGDWALCQAIQGPSMMESVLPRQQLAKALRDAAAIRRINDRNRPKFGRSQRGQPHYPRRLDNGRSRGRGAAGAQ